MLNVLKNLRLNVKIALLGAGSVLITAAALVSLAVWQSGQYNVLAQNEVGKLIDSDLNHITEGVYNLIRTENEAAQDKVDSNLSIARHILDGAGELIQSEDTVTWSASNQFTNQIKTVRLPKMMVGGHWLGNISDPSIDTAIVDRVTRIVGGTATIFQRLNERGDMLRVATTVKKTNGKRAVGTYIPAVNPDGESNPVIKTILTGERFHGRAFVVNEWYLTAYEPIIERSGKVVGMLYVGIRQKEIESRVRQAIMDIKLGKTGYVYVLGGKGEGRGEYIISQRGERDGEKIWETRDSDGLYVIKEIIAKATASKLGELTTERYRWQNPGEPAPRWKVARLAYYAPLDWVIGASVYEDELLIYREVLRYGRIRMINIMSIAGVAITVLFTMLGITIAWTIGRPVMQLKGAVEAVIRGDMNQVLEINTLDEIGGLANSFNVMTLRLKETLEELRRSEEKHRKIFENAIEGLFQTTLEGCLLSANPALARILGYDSPEEMITGFPDVGLRIYVNSEYRTEIIGDMLAHGEVLGRELQLYRRDGQRIWASLSARITSQNNGGPPVIEGFLYDITERKVAEDAWRVSERRLRELLENVNLVAVSLDAQGVITFCNDFFLNLVGWEREDVVGSNWFDLFSPLDGCERRKALFRERIEHGEVSTHVERPVVTRSGHFRSIVWDNTILHDADNVVVGIASIGIDVTDHRSLEEQLLQSQKMEAIGQLAGGIAHDFNNILTVIIGYGNILQLEMNPDDPCRIKVDRIMAATERAANLTHSLLAFSRKQVMTPKTINLNEIVNNMENFLQRIIGEDIQLVTIFKEDPIRVHVDVGQMGQVLLNLAANARDAMVAGGKLTVETKTLEVDDLFIRTHGYGTHGSYALITVTDTGKGMDEETSNKIFEPFFTTKEQGKGTGLGLSIVYGIVKQHKGYINVYSEPDSGTTFRIFIPAIKDENESHEDVSTVAPPKGGAETILVAEDDPDVRKLDEALLTQFGYEVLLARDGEEAVEIFHAQSDRISLVLMDMIMPKMSGMEAFGEIKQIRPDAKVLFCSGYTAEFLRERGELDEKIELIMKPIQPWELLLKVRDMIDR